MAGVPRQRHGSGARMNTGTGGPTLLRPDEAHRASASGPGSQGLPRDLVRQATPRLRVMALLYAAVFFLAGILPGAHLGGRSRHPLQRTSCSGCRPLISISVALFVAAVVTNPRLSPRAAAAIAIVFEIASSYGIAAAELLQPQRPRLSERHVDRALVGRRLDAPLHHRRSLVAPTVGARGARRIQQRARDGRRLVRGVPASAAAERRAVLLRLCLSVPAGRRDGVRRRARALRARQRGAKGPRAGQLPSSRAARAGRDGRGLARTSSPAGEAGRDQAHSSAGRAVDRRIRSREPVRARGAGDREPALTAHREPLRLRHRGRWDVLLRDGAPRRAGRRADREASSVRCRQRA